MFFIYKIKNGTEFSQDGTRLLKCAAGHEPISQTYTKTPRQCRVSFDRSQCVSCPYQSQCRLSILNAIVSGETDPVILRHLAQGKARSKSAELQRTLRGSIPISITLSKIIEDMDSDIEKKRSL